MVVDTSIAPARGVSGVDAARLGLIATIAGLIAAMVAFAGHRVTAPADGTAIEVSADSAAGSVGAAVQIDRPGAGPIEAGDRIVAVLGRDLDDWAGLLLDPSAVRPAVDFEDPVGLVVVRDGTTAPLAAVALPFDPIGAIAPSWGMLVLGLALAAGGVYAFVRRPDEPAARVVLVGGTALLVGAVGRMLGLQTLDFVTATGFWLYATTAGLAYALFLGGVLRFSLVFPRPHPLAAGRRSGVAWLVPVLALLVLAVGAGLTTGRMLVAVDAWHVASAVLSIAVLGAAAVLLATSYWRLVDPVSRLQLRWLSAAAALVAVGAVAFWVGPLLLVGEPFLPRSAMPLLLLPIPVALAVTVSRRHLFDLDAVVNRSVVYGGLTAGVIVTYALMVALFGRFIPGNAPFAVAIVSAGAVAVVALPLHDRLQRRVNRFMFGDRDDPDRALRRLGQRLEASLDPQTVLPTLVESVADAMRSPYVAIELEGEEGTRAGEQKVEAAAGLRPVDASGPRALIRLPIVYQGQPVGHLALCPRGPNEAFSAADERLLADLARQAAPAVEAIRLTADLRRSREALITAREEERRRLRRDLHDELGAALAGSMMKVAAARTLLRTDPTRTAELLDDLETDSRGMIDEVRRIAYNLRPPALDEVGLVGALRQHIVAFDEGGPTGRVIRATLDAPDALPALPAAVEVAALRIALESLTNAARHSGGSTVRVRLEIAGDALGVSVIDDGHGLAAGGHAGVGLTSMRERAEELGGTLSVETNDAGGTTVTANLPLARQSAT